MSTHFPAFFGKIIENAFSVPKIKKNMLMFKKTNRTNTHCYKHLIIDFFKKCEKYENMPYVKPTRMKNLPSVYITYVSLLVI